MRAKEASNVYDFINRIFRPSVQISCEIRASIFRYFSLFSGIRKSNRLFWLCSLLLTKWKILQVTRKCPIIFIRFSSTHVPSLCHTNCHFGFCQEQIQQTTTTEKYAKNRFSVVHFISFLLPFSGSTVEICFCFFAFYFWSLVIRQWPNHFSITFADWIHFPFSL